MSESKNSSDITVANPYSNKQPESTVSTQPTSLETNPFDIFSNPQIQRAKEALAPNVRAQYEQLGESLWNQIETSKITVSNNAGDPSSSNLPPPVEEAAAHISEALKSGMHPTLLEPEEKNVMKECFGSSWWERWGYTESDLESYI
jgi:hypothetical protein